MLVRMLFDPRTVLGAHHPRVGAEAEWTPRLGALILVPAHARGNQTRSNGLCRTPSTCSGRQLAQTGWLIQS